MGDVIKGLAHQGEYRQFLATEISGALAELLQQPTAILIRQAPDHLQEVLGELVVGHGLMLSPIQILLVRQLLLAPHRRRQRSDGLEQLQQGQTCLAALMALQH